CPPRLATSEWLVLSRRESHPLYITTYARSLQESTHSASAMIAALDIFEVVVYKIPFWTVVLP
ncbi:hypothetical protein, partial [Oceanobacillus bengalensis]|uniref:hypothetical protein n=1 Tax=Oceanobacillus bengalensis TaxID=1435466 RepID=UPI00362FDF32